MSTFFCKFAETNFPIMAELPELVKDLALILVVAGAVTLIFKKLKQPLVLGYIVAGFLVSPHMPYTMSVVDKADVQTWADIGVIFLLFSLGLDFSIKKILKMGVAPIISACTIIFCMCILGALVGHTFGWARMDCIFLGGMLAMSSTTIIYKAFDDMGLQQQGFANSVMSVLILEDILAIVMMVMLSTIASGQNPDGGQMIGSMLKIVFFLVLWFVVGLFAVPIFLRKVRKLMSGETLLVVALGLCCLMAVVSTKVGFSSAFGAFVMGSILAETIEADKIIKVVEPVKNLFGAIFFVSVGMLVDPVVLKEYALPIALLVLTILVGQAVFGTLGYLFSGQTLANAMRCGFSMAQIGEFAFIIASVGLSLGVVSRFLYPVVVAVSVITTFLTPYMIRAAEPTYQLLDRLLPKPMMRHLNHLGLDLPGAEDTADNAWRSLIRQMAVNTMIYGVLSGAVVALMLTLALPFCRHAFGHWIGNAVCGVSTVLFISPFLRSMVMKKNHSEEFKRLWTANTLNRLPLIFTIVVRAFVAVAFIFYVCYYLAPFANALLITAAIAILIIMVLSRGLKKQSIKLERMFIQNLRSRDIEAQVRGQRRPLFAERLLDRNLHIGSFDVPDESSWAGMALRDLHLRNRFGVHVSSIQRGSHRINIPGGDSVLFPGDRIRAIGDDEQLAKFAHALRDEIIEPDLNVEDREMKLRQLVLTAKSAFIGKTLAESGIRDVYNCMVVGVEEGQQKLTTINPQHCFERGDIIWIVGEEADLNRVSQKC